MKHLNLFFATVFTVWISPTHAGGGISALEDTRSEHYAESPISPRTLKGLESLEEEVSMLRNPENKRENDYKSSRLVMLLRYANKEEDSVDQFSQAEDISRLYKLQHQKAVNPSQSEDEFIQDSLESIISLRANRQAKQSVQSIVDFNVKISNPKIATREQNALVDEHASEYAQWKQDLKGLKN